MSPVRGEEGTPNSTDTMLGGTVKTGTQLSPGTEDRGASNGVSPQRSAIILLALLAAAVAGGHVIRKALAASVRKSIRSESGPWMEVEKEGRWVVERAEPGGVGGRPLNPVRSLLFFEKMNLATVTLPDLEALPGIGPALASRIIAWRDHRGAASAWADLEAIDGIGEKTAEELRKWIGLRP